MCQGHLEIGFEWANVSEWLDNFIAINIRTQMCQGHLEIGFEWQM